MIWIIAAINLILALLALLTHTAGRQDGEPPQPKAPTPKPHYGKPVLTPEWGKQKPPPHRPDFKTTPTIIQPAAADIRRLASSMAAEANLEIEQTTWLWNQVMDAGGLKPYRNERELEEFKQHVPPHFRRTTGTTPDQMADMLGYSGDQELYEAIDKEQRLRKSLSANLPNKRYTTAYFLKDAEEELIEQLNTLAYRPI